MAGAQAQSPPRYVCFCVILIEKARLHIRKRAFSIIANDHGSCGLSVTVKNGSFLLASDLGKHYEPRYYEELFGGLVEQSGFYKANFHSMRHLKHKYNKVRMIVNRMNAPLCFELFLIRVIENNTANC